MNTFCELNSPSVTAPLTAPLLSCRLTRGRSVFVKLRNAGNLQESGGQVYRTSLAVGRSRQSQGCHARVMGGVDRFKIAFKGDLYF